MIKLPRAVRNLIESFEKLPGIGPKSAQRLVFYLLHNPEAQLQDFADRLTALHQETVLCDICHNVSDQNPCPICSDQNRDQTQLCVVEQPLDVIALERSGTYHGRYHVLHGSIAPLSNIGPDQLFLRDITQRLSGVTELILATNPTMEGEATALYIVEMLKQGSENDSENDKDEQKKLKISRIGHGLPVGADIEYADGVTLKRAMEGRKNMD